MASLVNRIILIVFICSAALTFRAAAQVTSVADTVEVVNMQHAAYQLFLSHPDSSVALAKQMLLKANGDKRHYYQAVGHYILSKAYWAKANYSLSAEHGFKALKFFENTEHTLWWGKTLLSLARVFIDLQNFEHAKIYINRATTLANETKNEKLKGDSFREMSMLFSETKVYDSALYYADEGIFIFQNLLDTVNFSILYGRKAKIYFLLKDYRQSQRYNRLSLLFDSLVDNRRALGITYYQAALDAVNLNQHDSAIYLLRKSIPINRDIRNPSILIKVHSLLADIYFEKKMPALAFGELKISSQYKDSLYNTERSGQIQEMHSIYELSKKEEQIEQLAQDNVLRQQEVRNQQQFVAFLLACVILLGVTVTLLIRYRRLQEKTNDELSSKNRDIEHQKEEIQSQAETLQQLNDLKLKLFSVISHDLRGPLGTLHSLLDLLTKKQVSTEEFLSIAHKLKNSLSITQTTLDNLLNWSLSQMEGIKTAPKTINIKNNIQEACDLMDDAAQKKNIGIQKLIDEELLVKADADHVQLILRNLIHNAIKFSNPSDKIFVIASKISDYCLITVKDNGIGMSRDELMTLKSARQHFTKTGTSQEKGTGLGFLLCTEFVKLNGGDIDVKSVLNKGTEVNFTLPLA
ncbi:MAG TPA: HAMP domain-containing sensor histidine kinase [Chryseosolibacter sp.]|nr:HAMP domain-containing sensor histidine kinase [Chryseosolibacter sp.]